MLIIKYVLGLVLYFYSTAKHLQLCTYVVNFSHYTCDMKHNYNTIIANFSDKIVNIHHRDLIVIGWKLKTNMTLK